MGIIQGVKQGLTTQNPISIGQTHAKGQYAREMLSTDLTKQQLEALCLRRMGLVQAELALYREMMFPQPEPKGMFSGSVIQAAGGSGLNGRQFSDGAANFVRASSQFLSASTAATGAQTISAWLQTGTLGAAQNWFATTSNDVLAQLNSSNHFNLTVNGSTTVIQTASITIATGTWYHVVLLYDGTNVSIYINGVLQAGPTATTFTGGADNTLAIGGSIGGVNTLNGVLDEVKVFGRAWTTPEITADYAGGNGVSANPTDLTAAGISLTSYLGGYTFNGPGANLLADRSGNSKTLTNNAGVSYSVGPVISYVIFPGDAVYS